MLLRGRPLCYHNSVSETELPTADDVRAAATFLRGQVQHTPVIRCPKLDALSGVELFFKAECMQHIGAFKARGALLAVGRLDPELRARGVITYSSGNHAQAVALAARSYGVEARVAMPLDAPEVKVESVEALGAHITFAGTTSEERRQAALAIEADTGGAIVQPFDDPNIIAGQGTATLELCAQVAALTGGDQLDALLVPVGGGGLIAGACLIAEELGIAVYAVEPEGCDAMGQSLEAGERVAVPPGPTLADGLKPVMVGERNFAIARRVVRAPLRVGDEAIGRAMSSLLIHAKVLVEPSGAAALAAVLTGAAGALGRGARRVGILLSGGNVSSALVREILERYPAL
jgi:threonine dehydratase